MDRITNFNSEREHAKKTSVGNLATRKSLFTPLEGHRQGARQILRRESQK